ncbi:hypothetical protein AB0K21_44550 [Streptosporangium sp. NPDC049248]|uniref:hypothetical protein n=1 Tax=Streptosporangium sp. NPDC049248 TaxID=3155651 RepID=UPI003436038C
MNYVEDRGEDGHPLCSRCDASRMVPIMYGYPTFNEELEQALQAGLFVLGGCTLHPERWACLTCRTRYRELPEPCWRWGEIIQGVPMEIGILRDGEPARAAVTVRRHKPWTLAFQIDEIGVLDYFDQPQIIAQGDDLFGALQQLCRAAARLKVRLLVNGARRDAYRCQVDGPDTEHLVSFRQPGRPASLADTGAIFDPADASLIGTPDEQDHIHAGR